MVNFSNMGTLLSLSCYCMIKPSCLLVSFHISMKSHLAILRITDCICGGESEPKYCTFLGYYSVSSSKKLPLINSLYNPEVRSSQLLCGGSLKSCKIRTTCHTTEHPRHILVETHFHTFKMDTQLLTSL